MDAKRRRGLLRGHRKIDDLLALQPAHEIGDFVFRHRLVAELQLKQAALGAIDDRGLIAVQQCRDIGDAGVRRKPHQGARRRARLQIAGDRLVHAQRRGLVRGGLALHQHRTDHAGLQQ